jgi:hypothetical protein
MGRDARVTDHEKRIVGTLVAVGIVLAALAMLTGY